MSPFREKFTSYQEILPRAIIVADKWVFYAIGVGDLRIEVPHGKSSTPVILRETLHAPDMAMTIVSISRITKLGNSVTFEKDTCTIKNKQGKTIGAIKASTSGLYKVEHGVTASAAVTTERVTLSALHRRLGHVSVDTLRTLVRHNSIEGVSLIDEGTSFTCDSCDYAKLTRKAIKPERQAPPSTTFGEEIHSDVWGPSPVNSIGGNCYYITFTDDYSRYTWTRTLKAKSEALEAYKTFATWARTQHGAKIRRFRSDRGGEYTSNALEAFLREQGIEQRLTTHDTPQHNGVAESLNRRLLE
jgi:transposase InsO family protein